MKIILGVATILGGIAAIWFFWDKIKSRLRRLFNKQLTILDDRFEKFDGWLKYRDGIVLHTDEKSHTGKFSLKKSGFNDPNGGVKKISKIGRGILFSGWVYRPSLEDGGPADRLAIEDAKGNGYGFAVRHEEDSFLLFIESRVEGAFEKNLIIGKELWCQILNCELHFSLFTIQDLTPIFF